MVNWKTMITPIYLQNHDYHRKICIYTPDNGECIEKDRSEIEDLKETWRGFYVNTDKGMIGIFASDKGPVFFINDQRYLIKEGEYDFVLEDRGEKNEFAFYYNGIERYKIKYKKATDLGIHPYADEEFMDFFLWLSKSMKHKSFVDFYTLS